MWKLNIYRESFWDKWFRGLDDLLDTRMRKKGHEGSHWMLAGEKGGGEPDSGCPVRWVPC